MTPQQLEEKAIALGVAIGRRQAAERVAKMLRAVIATWSNRIAARGPVLGSLVAGLTRSFVEDLEREAGAIEYNLAQMQADERRIRAELETAKAAKPKRRWF